LLQDQYAALQEQHADVVDAHKLELEQLEEQLNESRSQADAVREKMPSAGTGGGIGADIAAGNTAS